MGIGKFLGFICGGIVAVIAAQRSPTKTTNSRSPAKPKLKKSSNATTGPIAHNGYKQPYPGRIKNCCTCSYWAGEHVADRITKYAYTPSSSTKGICNCQQSGFRNQQMPANTGSSCDFYRKWEQLC